ncbi:MAG TPA: CYTH domain-containing protein [Pseudonocardiaceae bacterium]|jgi:adenylate cyclase class 2|nr:CYTH domain-containing protein [Pseudonocardiaceae bacterium]
MRYIEVEKKFALPDPAALKAKLDELGAKPSEPDEYESAVEDVEAIRRLLAALDFTPLVTVDKTRKEWRLPEVEAVFDHAERHRVDVVGVAGQGLA